MTASEIIVTQKENSTPPRATALSFSSFLVETRQGRESINSIHTFSTERNIVLMHFCLQGACIYTWGKETFRFNGPDYNVLYISRGFFSQTITQDDFASVAIYVDEDFFFRQIPREHKASQLLHSGVSGKVFSENMWINNRIKNVIAEITNGEFEGHLKMLYVKAKIIELITLQLAHQEEEQKIKLKPEEIEKMQRVKDLIESNLDKSFTLTNLAQIAGTNEQYLKKHFKALYQHTVFAYALSCKMQKAKELLLTGTHRITEIAEMVGYQHATHFTNAFKKFFGYLPRSVKTKIVLWWCEVCAILHTLGFN